jgi:iron(III) transport system permease protein
VVALIATLVVLPIATVGLIAAFPKENIWPHLVATVLPRSVFETVVLLTGVGLITGVVGSVTAWVVTMYRFPGRNAVDRLLVLPLAVPTYIVAYCYVELLDYAGPLQTGLRSTFGWQSVRDYWFPEVRSLPGAVLLMSAVLYPYVYLSARASFVQQSVCALEVARTLGRSPIGTLMSVALPLARPAIAAGIALGLMECLNDLGAVQHLGVQTLTYSVYATWLQRSNLGGAAQLATVMLLFVALLFWAERSARGRAKFHHTTGHYRAIPFSDIPGWRGIVVGVLCALPFVVGFLVPFGLLLNYSFARGDVVLSPDFWETARHSLVLASIAAVVTVVLAVLLAYARRVAENRFTRPAAQVASLGYALPGTVLALGLLYPLAAFDNGLDSIMRSTFGISTGLILSGSVAALVLAYAIRFIAVAIGSIDAGFEKVSPNLDAAARTLGAGPLKALGWIHLPLLIPALGRRHC